MTDFAEGRASERVGSRGRGRAALALGLVALSGVGLSAACGPTQVVTPTPVGSGSAIASAQPRTCRQPIEANLAADQRTRALINKKRKGGIVPIKVAVDPDCGLQITVLDQCGSKGYYDFQPYSGQHKTLIHNDAELRAELPLGGDQFAHKLKDGQVLRSDEAYLGTFETSAPVRKQDLKGSRCSEATHYISKIYIGGFAMAAGPASIESAESIFWQPSNSVFLQEGNRQACEESGSRYENELCSVPLKIEFGEFSAIPSADEECAHDPCEAGDKLAKTCNTCVEAVCSTVGYCCTSHWDSGCINKAKQICDSPCTNCAHSLCEAGEKLDPTCNPCVQQICAQDSFCCNEKWDTSCANRVPTVCSLAPDVFAKQGCDKVTPSCSGGQIWDGKACVCPAGQLWDGFACVTPAACHDVCTAGVPQLASCDSCTDKICAADPYCCNTGWDVSCASKVKTLCNKMCPGDTPIVVPPPPCKSKGVGCVKNSDCCSSFCKAGKCSQPD
ncbi:MAG: hypothetical protein U0414_29780 [Polyangiaceae bacterium]